MKRALAAIMLIQGCASAPSWRTPPYDHRFQIAPPPILHAKPKKHPGCSHCDALHSSVPYALGRPLRASRLLGSPAPLDVNDFGEVIDSPWFENRIGKRRMTAAEIARGPDRSEGPAPGPLVVLSAKSAGKTPGFVVKDQVGTRFVVKLDSPAYPGLASGAEIISTKLLYAAGYHVPENHLVDLDVDRLVLGEGATTKGRYGEEVPLTEAGFEAMRREAARFPDRSARAIFSRFIDGKILGPFPFEGTTADDPNDRIAHERRRSVRGMWIFAAWLDNTDARPTNTLDAFLPQTENGFGYVKHYWIDFGTTMGSSAGSPKPPAYDHEYSIDWGGILQRTLAFGSYDPEWEHQPAWRYRCVGPFRAKGFDPSEWVPLKPVAPFDQATDEDLFWGASILARFDEEDLRAAAATARYPEEGAEDYVVAVLRARQLALLRYVFERMLPLGDPEVKGDRLEMQDLEVQAGLRDRARYRFHVRIDRAGGPDEELSSWRSEEPAVDLTEAMTRIRRTEEPWFLTVTFERDGSAGSVEVHLRVVLEGAFPVGLTRHRIGHG